MPLRPFTPQELDELAKDGYDISQYDGSPVPIPDTPVAPTSATAAGGRAALASALPTAAGGAAFGGTMLALAPETMGASLLAIPVAAGASYLASRLISAGQEAVIPDKWKEQLAQDVAEHPTATTVGSLATIPLGGLSPNIGSLAKGTGTIGAVRGVLGKIINNTPLTDAEAYALKMATGGAAMNAAIGAGESALTGHDITPGTVARDVALGALLTKPTPGIGKAFGFHDYVPRQPVTGNPEAYRRALAAPVEEPVQREPLMRWEPPKVFSPSEQIAQSTGIRQKIGKSAEESAKAIFGLQKEGVESIPREDVQSKVDAVSKKIDEYLVKKATVPAAKTEVDVLPEQPVTEKPVEVQQEPVSDLQTIVQDYFNAKGLTNTPEALKAFNDEILVPKGLQITFGDAGGNKGQYTLGTRKITLSDKATSDTAPHETAHDIWANMTPEQRAQFTTTAGRDMAKLGKTDPEEYFASQLGLEHLNRQLNIRGETPLKRWWNDFRANFKTRWGKEPTTDDLLRSWNYRMQHETGPKTAAAVGGVRNQEQTDREKFDEIWKKMKELGMEHPDFQKLWAEAEALKNKHGGLVPPVKNQPPGEGLTPDDLRKMKLNKKGEGRTPYPFTMEEMQRKSDILTKASNDAFKTSYNESTKLGPEIQAALYKKGYDATVYDAIDLARYTDGHEILRKALGDLDANEFIRRAQEMDKQHNFSERILDIKQGVQENNLERNQPAGEGLQKDPNQHIIDAIVKAAKSTEPYKEWYIARARKQESTSDGEFQIALDTDVRLQDDVMSEPAVISAISEAQKPKPEKTLVHRKVEKKIEPVAAKTTPAIEVTPPKQPAPAAKQLSLEEAQSNAKSTVSLLERIGKTALSPEDKAIADAAIAKTRDADIRRRVMESSNEFLRSKGLGTKNQPEGEGLLKSTILHTVRSEEDIPDILAKGLRRGSNVTMDGTKENQSLGHGVTLVYDKSDISAEAKGYNPNDGLVTVQRRAKPKAILVEIGDIIEDAPITMDELTTKLDTLTKKQESARLKEEEKWKQKYADYNSKLASIQSETLPGGKLKLSVPGTSETVAGAYDPRTSSNTSKVITTPGKSETYTIRDNFAENSKHMSWSLRNGDFENTARQMFAEHELGIKHPDSDRYSRGYRGGRDFHTEMELNNLYNKLDTMLEKKTESLPGFTTKDYVDSLKLPDDIPIYTYEANEDGGIETGTLRRVNRDTKNQGPNEGLTDPSAKSFLPGLASSFDKVEQKVSRPIAEAARNWQSRRDQYLGKMLSAEDALSQLPPEVINSAADKMREAFRSGEKLARLTPEEQQAAEILRDYYTWNVNERIANNQKIEGREAGKNPNYVPDVLNEQARYTLTETPNSPEAIHMKKVWADYVMMKSEGQLKRQDVVEHIQQYIRAMGSDSKHYASIDFGAVRKAQGYGLPDSMRETNARKALVAYGRRAAGDMAFYKELESIPEIQSALGIKNPITGKMPPIIEGRPDLSTTKEVKNMMNWIIGNINDSAIKHPWITAFSRLTNNMLLGAATGLRDTASITAFAVPYFNKFSDLAAYARGVANFRNESANALATAARQPHIDKLAFNELKDSPNRFLATIQKASSLARTLQGREAIENFNRDVTFSIGKELAKNNVLGAKAGHEPSMKFLERFNRLVDGDILTLEGDKLEAALNQMGKNFTDAVQGTYDGSGLPNFTTEGHLAPFLALQKWSIEKSNTIFKDVVHPFYTGENRLPMLTYLFASTLTGLGIQELNKQLSGKKPSDPTWKEALDKGDASAYASQIATIMQLSSYMGIVGDGMKIIADAAKGKTPRNPLAFPAYSAAADTADRIADAVMAVHDGEDPFDVISLLAVDLMSHNIQNARMVANRVNAEDTARKDKFRDLRVFNELEGKTASSIPDVNNYANLGARDFKRTGDIGEAVRMLPELLRQQTTKAGGDYEKLQIGLRGLKGNSYQTMPSIEELPQTFQNYYNFLARTQGKEAADARMVDYLRQKGVNSVKSSLIPSL